MTLRRHPILVLAHKELSTLLNMPATYVIFVLFLVLTGWLYVSPLFSYGQSSLDSFLRPLPLIFSFLIPALTMRSFSEEMKGGTIEYLSTLPLRDTEIVVGKYLALLSLLSLLLLFTGVYPLTLIAVGRPDPGQLVGGYLAAWSLGAMFAAVGLWASSLTRNQVVAFIVGFFICFLLYLLDRASEFVPGMLSEGLRWVGIHPHFDALSRGVVDTRDLLYWASGIFFFLAATLSVVHSKRWK